MASQEGAMTTSDELNAWLIHFGLHKYEHSLREAGLEEFGLIQTLDDEMVRDIIEEANMKKLHQKSLLKAVKAVKDGSYTGPAAPKQDTNESKQGYDGELEALMRKRSHLKGPVEVKEDAENNTDGKATKTIIFIGQTGAGKTTLINSMCNYLHRVSYGEPFRYKLIVETKNSKISRDTTKSQTQDISKYHLRQLPAIDHAVNIIDTPGFGDTEGPEQDLKIRSKFKRFFEEIPFIDAIYFVVKASDTRLGATQKYIFNMVLDLFGHNVKDNIFILFTFSDGADPPALKAVKKLGVPYADYFQINNSGFGLPGNKKSPTHKMFFNLGMEQFKIIYDALSKVKTQSTKLTVQTLKERDNITTWLFEIGQNVKTALDKINHANQTYKYLQANKDKIDANKDFKIPDTKVEVHEDPVPSGHYTTYCPQCVATCHRNCGIPDDNRKRGCSAMRDGMCTVCKNKCAWHVHKNMPYIIRRETVTFYRTKKEMADKYHMAEAEAAKCDNIMIEIMSDINNMEKGIRETIVKMKKSVNRLQEIALNKNVLTDDQYFDTLIASEKEEGRNGWQDRVKQLQSMKRNNKLLKDVYQDDKEPISWKNDVDVIKYQQEFATKKQNNNMNNNNNDDKATFQIGVGKYKIGVTFSSKQQ